MPDISKENDEEKPRKKLEISDITLNVLLYSNNLPNVHHNHESKKEAASALEREGQEANKRRRITIEDEKISHSDLTSMNEVNETLHIPVPLSLSPGPLSRIYERDDKNIKKSINLLEEGEKILKDIPNFRKISKSAINRFIKEMVIPVESMDPLSGEEELLFGKAANFKYEKGPFAKFVKRKIVRRIMDQDEYLSYADAYVISKALYSYMTEDDMKLYFRDFVAERKRRAFGNSFL